MKPPKSNQVPDQDPRQSVAFSDEEVRLIWKEIKDFQGWTRSTFFQTFQEKNPEFVTRTWSHKHLEKLLVLKPKSKKRAPVPPQWYPCIAKTFGWSPSEFKQYLTTGNRPSILPPFRDIRIKRWQEIPLEDRPHPWPLVTNNPPPPFPPKPSGEVDYVAGWNIFLRAGVRYRLTYNFGKNDAWPEIEIVMYQRVPRLNQGGELWKRVVSAGAVTSGECASDITPQSEEWLITCWVKTVIAWDAPWRAFVPKNYDLDAKNATLALSFTDQNIQDADGGLLTLPAVAKSRSVLQMQAVD